MKLIGFTCTYNEEEFIPYVMPYVEAFGYDKFIVYDNKSTDRTVELLSKYPFVEIREYDSGGSFDDNLKCELQIRSYRECLDMAHVGNPEMEEDIWMSWTDFDEVLFFNSDADPASVLDVGRAYYGYNCFYKRIINLFPPRTENDNVIHPFFNGGMVHTYEGIRGSYWTGGGMKPLLICVNDFPDVTITPGNHYMIANGDSQKPTPMNKECEIYAFHLKYIDKEALRRKWKGYVAKGKKVYVDLYPKFDNVYNGLYGVTFPLEQYFMADGFFSEYCKDGSPWSGIVYNRYDRY